MQEIEHKFLVRSMDFLSEATEAYPIDQGYLHASPPTLRVRVRAKALLALCGPRRLTKTRYLVPYAGYTWEVDVFSGRHEGLILAELEVTSLDETFPLPPWVGDEVTGNPRYYNGWLAGEQ